jgi:hypothetical protein
VSNLSYYEALKGVVEDENMDAIVGLIESHKNWGAFRAKVPSHLIINLIEEIKRLREKVGGFKVVPEIEVTELDLDALSDD